MCTDAEETTNFKLSSLSVYVDNEYNFKLHVVISPNAPCSSYLFSQVLFIAQLLSVTQTEFLKLISSRHFHRFGETSIVCDIRQLMEEEGDFPVSMVRLITSPVSVASPHSGGFCAVQLEFEIAV